MWTARNIVGLQSCFCAHILTDFNFRFRQNRKSDLLRVGWYSLTTQPWSFILTLGFSKTGSLTHRVGWHSLTTQPWSFIVTSGFSKTGSLTHRLSCHSLTTQPWSFIVTFWFQRNLLVSEILGQWIGALSCYVDEVYIYS